MVWSDHGIEPVRKRTPYVYIVVRKDISPVQRVVQASHAALEAGFVFKAPEDTCHLIILEVEDENALQRVAYNLRMSGENFIMFYEPDDHITGFKGNSALATRPMYHKPTVLSDLKLLVMEDK